MDSLKPLSDRIKKFWNEGTELIAVITGIVSTIFVLLNNLGKVNDYKPEILVGIDLLNIVVLLIALVSIKPIRLEINKGDELKKLKSHLLLNDESVIEDTRNRVNAIVRQLIYCIYWFSVILILFYLVQIYIDLQLTESDQNIKKALVNSNDLFQLITGKSQHKAEAAKFISVEVITNALNVLSAAFLFIAFQVLFVVTIDSDNKTWQLKWIGILPISIAFTIIGANILMVLCGANGQNLSHLSHVIRLIGGIFNGVAMFLLFSRFISMEYFFQRSKQKWQRNFYFYGTIIGLPLYVMAQPLYGLFNAVEFSADAAIFKSFVFLVCFWGKVVFLLFIFTMVNKKWMHSYLFIVLTQKDTVSRLSKELNDVQDLECD